MEHQDIKVVFGQTVQINIDYVVYFDLKSYEFPLQFAPSAKNSNT